MAASAVSRPANMSVPNSDAEAATLLARAVPTVVDFTASWCGPCRAIAPVVLELTRASPELEFIVVDIDRCNRTASKYAVSGTPTFMFFDEGKPLDHMTFSGAVEAKLRAAVQALRDATVGGGGGGAAAARETVPGTNFADLSLQIRNMSCQNLKPGAQWKTILTDGEEFVETDVDEQALLYMAFPEPVKLHSIKIDGPRDGSAPRTLRLFANHAPLDFDVADTEASTQDIVVEGDALGTQVRLKLVKFNNVHNLTVFVQSNQGEGETTRISRLMLLGARA